MTSWEFWSAVCVIELTDIAFAIDSILAAIALVAGGSVPEHGFHPKLWVIVTGGFLGVILMRLRPSSSFACWSVSPGLRWPPICWSLVIGGKLLVDWGFNKRPIGAPESWHAPLDFHSPHTVAFWLFWVAMLLCFSVGFMPHKKKAAAAEVPVDCGR